MRLAAARLRAGDLVAVPTETVYGLAADALNPAACRKIFTAKGRPAADPLIVHVADLETAKTLAEFGPTAERLASAFWPGPLTLVLPKKPLVPDIVTAGRSSVALRMPAHPVARRVLRLTGRPLAAPSANPFGYVSPTTAEHVATGLGKRIELILDGGPCAIGVESTIVDLRDPRRPRLLRPGGVSRREIERTLGRKFLGPEPRAGRATAKTRGYVAPGQMARHYSPRTPLVLHSRITADQIRRSPSDEAWLVFQLAGRPGGPNVFSLSRTRGLAAAARGLFAALRRIDEGGWRTAHAELAKGSGLADAINDRLRRAAARR